LYNAAPRQRLIVSIKIAGAHGCNIFGENPALWFRLFGAGENCYIVEIKHFIEFSCWIKRRNWENILLQFASAVSVALFLWAV
jgi:hypothetical protein